MRENNKVLYIVTTDFRFVDSYFTVTISHRGAKYALKDKDEWDRFTGILREVMKKELNKERGDEK